MSLLLLLSLQYERTLRAHSYLRFIRRELLYDFFSPRNLEKWIHNPLLNISVQTKVDQIAGECAHLVHYLNGSAKVVWRCREIRGF